MDLFELQHKKIWGETSDLRSFGNVYTVKSKILGLILTVDTKVVSITELRKNGEERLANL